MLFYVVYFSVFNYEQSDKKVQRDLKLIIFVMIALILIVWKRRWFYLTYQKLKKKIESDKYALCKVFSCKFIFTRTIKYNIIMYIVFYYFFIFIIMYICCLRINV